MRAHPGLEDELLALIQACGIGSGFAQRDYPHGLLADEPDRSPREVDLYLTLTAEQEPTLRALLERCREHLPGCASLRLEMQPAPPPEADDPNRLWQAQWKPFRCAGFFIYAEFIPRHRLSLRPTDTEIVLVAGSAFGTGAHPTTRMALRAVRGLWERERPQRWLDVGTGSGILAVAAAKLGAARVDAMDPEAPSAPQALRMAALNGVAPCVQAWRGGFDSARGRFEAVIANLFADLLQDAAPALADLVAPGGTLYAGGIVDRRWGQTERQLAATGLQLAACDRLGRWYGSLWRRPGRAAW